LIGEWVVVSVDVDHLINNAAIAAIFNKSINALITRMASQVCPTLGLSFCLGLFYIDALSVPLRAHVLPTWLVYEAMSAGSGMDLIERLLDRIAR